MTVPEDSGLYQQLREELAGSEEYLTAVETHGLLCAMAIHPAPPEDWQAMVSGDDTAPPERLATLMERERLRLSARLGAGDHIHLPCRLDPEEERDGEDLAAWCTGFMAGVLQTEADWRGDDPDMESLLLPFLLFSGLDEDPELDELWRDGKLVRQMARGIPDLLEELFLRLQAPELKDID